MEFKDTTLRSLLPKNPICMEIGVGPLDQCRLRTFIEEGIECHLVEALWKYGRVLYSQYQHLKNVHLYPFAACDQRGPLTLFDRGEGSWLVDLPASPDTMNNAVEIDPEYCNTVPGITIDMIDTGELDLLLVDIEGAEWWVLKHLVSHPKVIVLETHLTGGSYINPYMIEIERWMEENGYVLQDKNISDSLYILGCGL